MQKSDFNAAFEHAYTSSTQNEFETWFRVMMECVYKGDFEIIKAGGVHGDKKSDGRIISEEKVFQCYAPESPATFASKAPGKIKDSFPKIFEYWPKLKVWVFVHNNAGGIGTSVSDVLDDLRDMHDPVKIEEGSRRLLKDLHDSLTLQQLIDIYPSVLLDFGSVQMGAIRPLLRKIEAEHQAPTNPMDFGEEPDPKSLNSINLALKHGSTFNALAKGLE